MNAHQQIEGIRSLLQDAAEADDSIDFVSHLLQLATKTVAGILKANVVEERFTEREFRILARALLTEGLAGDQLERDHSRGAERLVKEGWVVLGAQRPVPTPKLVRELQKGGKLFKASRGAKAA